MGSTFLTLLCLTDEVTCQFAFQITPGATSSRSWLILSHLSPRVWSPGCESSLCKISMSAEDRHHLLCQPIWGVCSLIVPMSVHIRVLFYNQSNNLRIIINGKASSWKDRFQTWLMIWPVRSLSGRKRDWASQRCGTTSIPHQEEAAIPSSHQFWITFWKKNSIPASCTNRTGGAVCQPTDNDYVPHLCCRLSMSLFLFLFFLSLFVCLSDSPLFIPLPFFYIHSVVELPNRLLTNRLMVTLDKQNHQCCPELSKLLNVESKVYGRLNTINFNTSSVNFAEGGTVSLC